MRLSLLAIVAVVTAAAVCAGGAAEQPEATSSGGGAFPVVMLDAQGVEVTVPTRPERIVSTSPTVTEMLFALGAGDRVVGVTEQCDYPTEVDGLRRVGGFWTPSVERVLGANPDIVIAQRGNPPDFVKVLRKSGVPVFTIDPKTMAGIHAAIRQVATMIGDADEGEKLIDTMETRLAAVRERVGRVPQGGDSGGRSAERRTQSVGLAGLWDGIAARR
jgi:iron complex transport system substrate-binding protein